MDTTRYRHTGALTETVQTYRSRSYPISCANRTTTAWSAYGTSLPRFGHSKTIFDVVTPNYWRRRKKGEFMPLNPYDVYEATVTASGTSTLRDTWQAPTCTPPLLTYDEYEGAFMPSWMDGYLGGYTPQNVLADGRSSTLTTQVITACLADRQKGKANYVESAAELNKTFAMLADPLVNVRKFLSDFSRSPSYRELQRLRKKYPGKFSKTRPKDNALTKRERNAMLLLASSEYLRFRYGISPLMSDVKVAVAALKRKYQAAPVLVKSRANGALTGYQVKPATFGNVYTTYTLERVNQESLTVRASYYDRIRYSIFDEVGLSFHNVVGVVWELTRLSFVVDWFVNVGDLIYANIPRVNVEPMGGTYTVRDEVWNSGYVTSVVNLQPSVTVRTSSHADRVDIHVKRTSRALIGEQWLRGGLVVKSDFRFDQYTRCADAIAIVIQQLHGLSF